MKRLRIFFASLGVKAPDGGPGLWAVNLRDPLLEMGHTVIESKIDWDQPLGLIDDQTNGHTLRAENSERLLEEVRKAHQDKPLDLFFSYFYNVHVTPEVIRQIRSLGIPAVNFYCNAAHQFHLVREIVAAFDYCWVPERQALPYYQEVGARALHIQMGASPSFYRPLPDVTRDVRVSFSGSLYADRAQWLAKMRRRGLPVEIFTGFETQAFGNGQERSRRQEALEELIQRGPFSFGRRAFRYWRSKRDLRELAPALRPPQFNFDMVRLFNRSEAVVNLSHVFDGGMPGGRLKAHVRLREFEAPLCRVVYCPQWCDELEQYFDPIREVVAWRTIDELHDRLTYYLSHPVEADKIREAGYRRALAEHTAQHRFRQLFQSIGFATN